jgi:hypothetical protein
MWQIEQLLAKQDEAQSLSPLRVLLQQAHQFRKVTRRNSHPTPIIP